MSARINTLGRLGFWLLLAAAVLLTCCSQGRAPVTRIWPEDLSPNESADSADGAGEDDGGVAPNSDGSTPDSETAVDGTPVSVDTTGCLRFDLSVDYSIMAIEASYIMKARTEWVAQFPGLSSIRIFEISIIRDPEDPTIGDDYFDTTYEEVVRVFQDAEIVAKFVEPVTAARGDCTPTAISVADDHRTELDCVPTGKFDPKDLFQPSELGFWPSELGGFTLVYVAAEAEAAEQLRAFGLTLDSTARIGDDVLEFYLCLSGSSGCDEICR